MGTIGLCFGVSTIVPVLRRASVISLNEALIGGLLPPGYVQNLNQRHASPPIMNKVCTYPAVHLENDAKTSLRPETQGSLPEQIRSGLAKTNPEMPSTIS
jgi:hypothetical protein